MLSRLTVIAPCDVIGDPAVEIPVPPRTPTLVTVPPPAPEVTLVIRPVPSTEILALVYEPGTTPLGASPTKNWPLLQSDRRLQ